MLTEMTNCIVMGRAVLISFIVATLFFDYFSGVDWMKHEIDTRFEVDAYSGRLDVIFLRFM